MMAPRQVFALGVLACAVLSTSLVEAQSSEPREVYNWTTIGLGGDGADSFIDRHAGSDMLPYTEDDMELPERGNVGGTWGVAHHDLDSDGVVDDDEHIFVVIRRGDDDQFSFSANNHPEYGVLYESEDWIDYHDARNEGPSATLIGSLDAEGNDFEHNDRPDWEGESNAYLYNNLRADQHGKGKPRWYFENINPGSEAASEEDFIYDEPEGFQKVLNFQHNMDDPTTPFDERGECRREYFRTHEAVTRGYLLPLAELEDLEDGSLESLFGWEPEDFDLAAYFRDVIAPKLRDPTSPDEPNPDLTVFHPEIDDRDLILPYTHIALLQIEVPIVLNDLGACGNPAQAQAMAEYWGIPETGATYRVSHLLGFNAELIPITRPGARPWEETPADGAERNLWALDHFFRDRLAHLGRYATAPQDAFWAIAEDPAFTVVDDTINRVLSTETGGMVSLALPRPLGGDELPLELVADVGGGEDTAYELILLAGDEVRAYAEVSVDGSAVRLGGEGVDDGWITGGEGATGDPADVGSAELGEYVRFVLRVSCDGVSDRISLLERAVDFAPNDFTELNRDEMIELASVSLADPRVLAGVDTIAVAASGAGAVSTIALLAAPPGTCEGPTGGLQLPGDCSQDGLLNITDAICLLGHLFLGVPASLPCGAETQSAPNVAVFNANTDQEINITDVISVLQFLFIGGPPPAPCMDRSCMECIRVPGCPDNQRGNCGQ